MKDKIRQFYFANKKMVIIFCLVLVIVGFYFYYSQANADSSISYFLGEAKKGDITVSISSSGQVSDSNQLDIKPKISATITGIKVKNGQKVKMNDVLIQLDNRDLAVALRQAQSSVAVVKADLDSKLAGLTPEDLAIAQKSLESSKVSYESSKVSLENAKKTAEQGLKKAQISLDNAELSLKNAERQYQNTISSGDITDQSTSNSLTNAYENAKLSINSSYITLRSALVFFQDILDSNGAIFNNLGVKDSQTLINANNSLFKAEISFSNFESLYDNFPFNDSQSEEDNLLGANRKTLMEMKTLADDLYEVFLNTVTSVELPQTILDNYKQQTLSYESSLISSLNSIQGIEQNISNLKLNINSTDLSSSNSISSAEASLTSAKNNLLSAQTSFDETVFNNQKSIDSAQVDVNLKKASYESAQAQYNLKIAKPREVDIASLRVSLAQAQNSYLQALNNYRDTTIVSPIDGQVAKIYFNKGDLVSSSGIIITIISQQQLANVSFNEIDVSQIKIGQRALMTFNAVEELIIEGTVAEVDAIGTVNQGVVSYAVKVVFSQQDERVKPQMSVSVEIITAEKKDVLRVPNSALKEGRNNSYYVEYFSEKTTLDKPSFSAGANTNNNANEKNPSVNNSSALANNSQRTGFGNLYTSDVLPERKIVEIGLANDSYTEIISGLNENDVIVFSSVSTSSTTTASSTASGQNKSNNKEPNAFRMLGGGGMH